MVHRSYVESLGDIRSLMRIPPLSTRAGARGLPTARKRLEARSGWMLTQEANGFPPKNKRLLANLLSPGSWRPR